MHVNKKLGLSVVEFFKKVPLIKWINETGFRKERHFEIRGIEKDDEFGIADTTETLRRQEIMKYLVSNEKVRELIKPSLFNTDLPEYWYRGQRFVNYFNPEHRNAFWEKVDQVINALSSTGHLPPAIEEFVLNLASAKLRFEQEETKLTNYAVKEFLYSTNIEGTMILRLNFSEKKPHEKEEHGMSVVEVETAGYRLYALNPPDEFSMEYSKWNRKFWRATGVFQIMSFINEQIYWGGVNRWAKPIVITECPNIILEEIKDYLGERVVQHINRGYGGPDGEAMAKLLKDDDIHIFFSYTYGANGLRIKMLGLNEKSMEVSESFEKEWVKTELRTPFAYFDLKMLDNITSAKNRIKREVYLRGLSTKFIPLFEKWLKANCASDFISDEGLEISDDNIDREYKWRHVEHVCQTKERRDTFARIVEIRRYVDEHINRFGKIVAVANAFVERSKEWNLPLTFPVIVEGNEPTLSFKRIWPVSLIGRKTSDSNGKKIEVKDLHPICALGEISGRLSIMTGENGAGKSTTGEEILGLIYDSAAGFPLFDGQGVFLSMKKVVGTVFIERGDGSTMQLSMKKMADVITEAEKIEDKSQMFIFIDELGTGTTKDEGFKLGEAYLWKLRKMGCTVLVNTQITELAEFAKNELGANCLQMDGEHYIRSGVGTADVRDLAERMGLSKVLGFK